MRLASLFKQYLKAESGVAAVEFALVATPFFWLFLAMFETGLMLFTDYALQAGVQTAARLIRTGQVQNGTVPLQFKNMDLRQIICSQTVVIGDCEAKLSLMVKSTTTNFAAFKASAADVLTVGGSGTAATYVCNPGGSQSNVIIIATYDWKFHVAALFDGIYDKPSNSRVYVGGLSNISGGKRRLVGYAVFQSEPYTNTSSTPASTC